MGPLAQVGLALATAVGAWINLLLVLGFAVRAGYLVSIAALVCGRWRSFVVTGVVLAAALWSAARFAAMHFAQWGTLRDEAALLLLIVVGAVVYAGSILLAVRQELAAVAGSQLKPFALYRIPLQYAPVNPTWQAEIGWLPSNLASVKACSARKTMR